MLSPTANPDFDYFTLISSNVPDWLSVVWSRMSQQDWKLNDAVAGANFEFSSSAEGGGEKIDWKRSWSKQLEGAARIRPCPTSNHFRWIQLGLFTVSNTISGDCLIIFQHSDFFYMCDYYFCPSDTFWASLAGFARRWLNKWVSFLLISGYQEKSRYQLQWQRSLMSDKIVIVTPSRGIDKKL